MKCVHLLQTLTAHRREAFCLLVVGGANSYLYFFIIWYLYKITLDSWYRGLLRVRVPHFCVFIAEGGLKDSFEGLTVIWGGAAAGITNSSKSALVEGGMKEVLVDRLWNKRVRPHGVVFVVVRSCSPFFE